jgi:hypothetical protein
MMTENKHLKPFMESLPRSKIHARAAIEKKKKLDR